MIFFETFPTVADGRPPFALAMANLERSIPGCRAQVERLQARVASHPDNTERRADLQLAAQKLARRYKSSADLIAIFLHQHLGTNNAPDAATAYGLMTYHDDALREAFRAKCTAFDNVYNADNKGRRVAHLRGIYDKRLFLGGSVADDATEPRSPAYLPQGSTPAATHAV